MLTTLVVSCGFQLPEWNGKIWAGDAARGGITRAQSNEHIQCTDTRFDDYLAVSYADWEELMKIITQCKEWSDNLPLKDAEKAVDKGSLNILRMRAKKEGRDTGGWFM